MWGWPSRRESMWVRDGQNMYGLIRRRNPGETKLNNPMGLSSSKFAKRYPTYWSIIFNFIELNRS